MSLDIQADLTLDLVSGGSTPSTLSVLTMPDGAIHVASVGLRPRLTVFQTRVLFQRARAFVRATGQSLRVTHQAREIFSITKLPGGEAKTNIRWWSLIRTVLTPKVRD